MCFGGGGTPAVTPAPVADPIPPASPTAPGPGEEAASKLAGAKDKQLKSIKFGIASTMRSGGGDTSKPSLMTPQAMGINLKTKTGQ